MKKLLGTLLLSTTISFAGLVDAVALVVNDEPITLYDIDKRMVESKVSKKEAVSSLIDEALYEQLLQEKNISVDIFDVNNYLEKIAASNGMDLYTFKSVVKQKYKNYDAYEDEIRKRIQREKLIGQLVRGNLKIATQEDLKIYYKNNKNQFTTAKTIDVVQYASKNKKALLEIQNNPMTVNNEVSRSNISLDQEKLNSQMRFLLNDTKINQFTPIITADEQYVTLLVTQKKGVNTLAFEDVKDKIFTVLMQKREQNFLKEYFEKLKLTANIKVVR
ncbi:peptidylprolyl isomerase [Malaciobacter marinus]|uniref:peptidylprolyl isomerase n=1 Tax=Malaciobacter marinus TaxID=505249 RepID=UPI0009A8FFF3|nr:peptidylprolyl isomerase [Malaciobacter marinus]SKB45952.1 SurA N-terminal domain-containing protein [Malaciobacter marinus]